MFPGLSDRVSAMRGGCILIPFFFGILNPKKITNLGIECFFQLKSQDGTVTFNIRPGQNPALNAPDKRSKGKSQRIGYVQFVD